MPLHDVLDRIDRKLCQLGILRAADWTMVREKSVNKLYAGGLYRHLSQFKTHIGISPFEYSTRNINHDLRDPLPIADNSIDIFQSEDVFEHIPYPDLPPIIEEIFRILKPSGLFRLSIPDYRCPLLLERTVKNAAGEPLFDPGGGGAFVDGKVIDGGHVWFPIYETVRALFEGSSFQKNGNIQYLHYTKEDGESVLSNIDYSKGYIQRTPDNDQRTSAPCHALSIVVDATKGR